MKGSNAVGGPWELPQDWGWKRIDDVAPVNPKRRAENLNDDDLVSFVPMAAVSEETGKIDVSQHRPARDVRKGYTRFRTGDVLFAKITPCMENGKIAVVPDLHAPFGAGSTEFHVLAPEAVEARYLFYWLSRRSFRHDAEFNMTGTAGQKRVPPDYLRNALIPLPPLETQRRIVARINELFSELDDGEEELTRARADLEIYRKSLLKAAVTGELTADWRGGGGSHEPAEAVLARIAVQQGPHKRKGGLRGAPPQPDQVEHRDLPVGWSWTTLPALGEFGRGKSKHRPRNDPRLYGGKYPFVQTGVVAASRGLITTYQQTYTELGLAQSKLWPAGTLCITIAANIAKTGVLTFDACFPDSVVGLTCGHGVMPEYVELVVRSLQADLERDAPATAQKNINLETFAHLPIPLPPTAEQEAVVQAFQEAEAAAEILVRDDLDRDAVTLRQSILAAAFRGDLA